MPPLEFEQPIVELEEKIQELKKFSGVQNLDFRHEISRLEKKLAKLQAISRWYLEQGGLRRLPCDRS